MTDILDRIQTVRNKLDGFKNSDQAREIISGFSADEQSDLGIFLAAKKNLKSFIDKMHDVDDELMIWLEILGIYLMVPDEDRRKESKENIKKRKERYRTTIGTYKKVKKDPLLRGYFDVDIELLKELLASQRILDDLKKRRVRDLTEIKKYLKPIIKVFKDNSWNKTQQTDFIYDLFYSFNYDNCRNIDPEPFKKKLWMMIHRL